MNISAADAQELYRHEPEGVPIDDVLKARFKVWNMEMPELTIEKQQIRINYDRKEAVFVTPAVEVLVAAVNNAGVISHGKAQHYLKISKRPLNQWNSDDKALPYPSLSDFFSELEKVLMKCLRFAFDSPDLFEKATETAWEHVNMEAEKPEEMAFDVFVSNAKKPFDGSCWEIKKNMIRGKGQKVFVPLVDLTAMEHTGRFELDKGATVSVAIRLWPYYISANVYGVAASFSDAGIQVWHKGGNVMPRRIWKDYHHHLIISDRLELYDIRGSFFIIKTPIVEVVEMNGSSVVVAISKEKQAEWCNALSRLVNTLASHMKITLTVTPLKNTETHLLVRVQAARGMFVMNQKGIIVLRTVLAENMIAFNVEKSTRI